jgi:hypothetical protein
MLLDVTPREKLLENYTEEYVKREEARCFFKLGDIINLSGVITQVDAICTGGIAYAHGSTKKLRYNDDAKLLWRAV